MGDAAQSFEAEYLKNIVLEHRNPNLLGLGTLSSVPLDLEKVYVELRIVSRDPLHVQRELIAEREIFEKSLPIWAFLQWIAKSEGVGLSVLGPPGSGKTTLLRSMALNFAHGKQNNYQHKRLIPLVFFLREQALRIEEESPSLGLLAQQDYQRRFGKFRSKALPPDHWFEEQLEAGNCIVLLDGLDEVASQDARRRASAWVDEQIKAYSRSLFVISARPGGYREAPLTRAKVLEVQPFHTEQVKEFVYHWYEMQAAFDMAVEGEDARVRAKHGAEDLLKRILGQPAIDDLTHNPLLLTMVALLHCTRRHIPEQRVDLYGEICDVMLERWHAAKGLDRRFTAVQLREVLEPLAEVMMKKKTRELDIEKVLDIINSNHVIREAYPFEERGTFLPMLEKISGLFFEREAGIWSFAHLSFQEYLAASYYRRQKREMHVDEQVSEEWWHETLRMYAAMGDATGMVKACLKANTVSAFVLMHACLKEASALEDDARAQAEQRLIGDLESEDSARRRLAAEVKLAIRLRNLHPVSEDIAIDLEYISAAEFELLDVAFFSTNSYLIRLLSCLVGNGRCANSLAIGIPQQWALAFIKRLNKKQGFKNVYRLPSAEEDHDYPPLLSPKNVFAWCSGENGIVKLNGLPDAMSSEVRNLLSHLNNETQQPNAPFFPPPMRVDYGWNLYHSDDNNLDVDLMNDLITAFFGGHYSSSEDMYEALVSAPNGALEFAQTPNLIDLIAKNRSNETDTYPVPDGFRRRLERDLAYNLRIHFIDILDCLASYLFDATDQLPNALVRKQHDPIGRKAQLFCRILALYQAQNARERMVALLRYLAVRMEHHCPDYNPTPPPEVNYLHTPPTATSPSCFHDWVLLIASRLEGTLPVFEGIRIVRERIKKTS